MADLTPCQAPFSERLQRPSGALRSPAPDGVRTASGPFDGSRRSFWRSGGRERP
jgi:hypothetical protein